MKIYVNAQILSGNLGEGWTNQNDAAGALAAYTEKQWAADLAPVIAEGHEVEIGVEVQRNASGCGREVSVDVDDDDMQQRVVDLLTDKNQIWERFCESDEAAEYVGGE